MGGSLVTTALSTARSVRRFAPRLVALAIAAASAFQVAAAEDYEMRFCAPLNSWPSADRERDGFDVEIARLLADDLGAEATFEWIRFDEVGVRDALHAGLCDAMVGMAEGAAGTLNSVGYLRTPYVFVSLAERNLSIESMDDPILQDLTIATYQFGTPTLALTDRGLDLLELAAGVREEGVDTHGPIIEAVLDGTADVGVVYGPVAGMRIVEGAPLRIEQVLPEVDFGEAIIQLSRIWTIGVRPHDEALRDRLNEALARRWDDVQAIFMRYGVPTLDLPRPREAAPLPDDVLRIGVVYPARTPAQLPGYEIGEAARMATMLADNEVGRSATLGDLVHVYKASAPSLEATLRAARAMIAADGVDIVIGGYDARQAAGLAAVAAEENVVFLNAGSERMDLRQPRCFPTTVHVAPDVAGYVRGIVASGLALDPAPMRWFVVAERPHAHDDSVQDLLDAVVAGGGAPVGSTIVETGQFLYFDTFAAIDEAAADAVLLIMNEEQQELFLSQADAEDPRWVVTGLPTLRSQSRAFLQRFLQVSRSLTRTPRVAAWDPSLDAEINDRFASRTAEPMGGASWATYAAFTLAFEAAERGAGRNASSLIASWLDATGLDVAKNDPAYLLSSTMQIASTTYLVAPVDDAPWGRSPAEKTATARIVGSVPADVAWPPNGGNAAANDASCPTP